jgi:CheY-like chemotaxis protein
MTQAAAKAPSMTDHIAAHIPLLRRYARALTGSQNSGDAHVAALLEALIVDRSLLDPGSDMRVALYAAFQQLWDSVSFDDGGVAAEGREGLAQERLEKLTPRSRQALLLTAVEGFTASEAAQIMRVGADEVGMLVDDAVNELKRQTRARVLIIEDEPIIAMDIETIVLDMGHEVVDIADTKTTAVEAAMTHRPDLVLADIQLADGSSGIDAVREILSAFSAPVIFITAFPDRLLTGARPEPTFLISKPFRTETVQASISQALFFRAAAEIA